MADNETEDTVGHENGQGSTGSTFDVDTENVGPIYESSTEGCRSFSDGGYACTRFAGHGIPHVATAGLDGRGVRRIAAVWWTDPAS